MFKSFGVASARVGCPTFMFFFKYLMLKVMHRTVWSYVLLDLVFWPHSLALATSYFQLLLGCLQKLSSETVLWKILVHQISCLTREMNSAKTFPDPRWPPLYNVTTPCARHVHEKKVCRLQRATQTMHWPSKTAKTLRLPRTMRTPHAGEINNYIFVSR